MPYDGRAEPEGRRGPASRPAPDLVRGLPRPQDHGACGSRGPASSTGIKALKARQGIADYDPNRDATPAGDAVLRAAASATSSTTSRARQGRHLSLGQWPARGGDRGVLRRGRASRTGCTRRPATRCSRRSTRSSRCGARACTRAPASPARTATCRTSAIGALEGERPLGAQPAAEPRTAPARRATRSPEAELAGRVLTSRTVTTRCCSARPKATTDMLDAIVARQEGRRATEADLQAAARAAPEGAVAARLRGRRELDGLPRAPGAGAHPRRDHRLRAPGTAFAADRATPEAVRIGRHGKLDGKVALISGGARGQGAAEAETFTREGAKVVFGDIRDAEGAAGRGRHPRGRRGGQLRASGRHRARRTGRTPSRPRSTATARLDILINNAAIVIPRVPDRGAHRRRVGPGDGGERQGRVPGHQARAFPAMRRAGGGSIVNISSMRGHRAVAAPGAGAMPRARAPSASSPR